MFSMLYCVVLFVYLWVYAIFCMFVLVAGVVSHSLDYRKSAGGFIHGFRYTGM